MTDDIVTRLRETADYCKVDGNSWGWTDCLEAADEIERLRIKLEQKQHEVHEYDRLYQRAEAKLRKLQEKYEEA